MMNPSLMRWLVIALIYASFHFWYGGSGDPMTPKEVEHYVSLAAKNGNVEQFKKSVNLLQRTTVTSMSQSISTNIGRSPLTVTAA